MAYQHISVGERQLSTPSIVQPSSLLKANMGLILIFHIQAFSHICPNSSWQTEKQLIRLSPDSQGTSHILKEVVSESISPLAILFIIILKTFTYNVCLNLFCLWKSMIVIVIIIIMFICWQVFPADFCYSQFICSSFHYPVLCQPLNSSHEGNYASNLSCS